MHFEPFFWRDGDIFFRGFAWKSDDFLYAWKKYSMLFVPKMVGGGARKVTLKGATKNDGIFVQPFVQWFSRFHRHFVIWLQRRLFGNW